MSNAGALATSETLVQAGATLDVASGVTMRSPKVTVDGGTLRLWFGAGLLRREVPLSGVVAARPLRVPWYTGWGVRAVPRGWLYRVGGRNAVELELENGRVVCVGSDEPAALLAALTNVLGQKEGA